MNMKKKEEDSLGQKILQALTQDQVGELLDGIFNSQEYEKIASLFADLDPDISSTLDLYLNPEKTSKKPELKVVSNEKLMEEWTGLWRDWEEIIFNAGDEEGEYVHQDYHWEEPYFSHDDVAKDVENIAKKMWPLLKKIHILEIRKDIDFEAALKDVSSSIQTLPEWFGARYERWMIGPVTTKCFLQWEWLIVKAGRSSALFFIKRIIKVDSEMNLFYLNDKAVVDFFLLLPDKARKEIYDDMTCDNNVRFWQPHLESSLSKWYRIYHGFSQLYSPEKYLENCRNSIDEDWEYGLPLLKHLIKLRDYAEAEKIVQQTCSSYLDYRTDKPWQPEQSLFIDLFLNYRGISDKKKSLTLLSYWKSIAKGLGQTERAAALELQIIICKKPFEWDDVVNAFKDVRSLSYEDLASRLFHHWQMYILKRCIQRITGKDTEAKKTWIYCLLETGWDDLKDKIWFEEQVSKWLVFLLENPDQFRRQKDLIYILSNDLAQDYSLKKKYPNLFKYVLNYYNYGELTKKSRIAWLKRMNG